MELNELKLFLKRGDKLHLTEVQKSNITKCRKYLDDKLNNSQEPIYGVSTGFGSLCNISIDQTQLETLQTNLVISHACGMGDLVPQEIVKLMLLLKIESLSYGFSGVKLDTVQRLVDMYNNDVLPVIYQQGSLGASGDLAPLAHMTLPMINLGEVFYKGERKEASEVNSLLNWKPITLSSKEGLALLNGTQFMLAYGIRNLFKAERLIHLSDLISALSIEAFNAKIEPFYESVHRIRPHEGQLETASIIRKYLKDSELQKKTKNDVQDPYSFRCIPQIHGATKDAVKYIRKAFDTELHSATDNPTILPDEDMIVSAGNFHGQPLALPMDHLAIAMAELGSVSERRIYQLISGKRGLPSFLAPNPGLNSGFMIPQYTAASIVSQNKQLCTPSSVDTIDSSQGQEDHVSMGANSAIKCHKVIDNVETILAIELLNAAQAFDFRKEDKTSLILERFYNQFREKVPFISNDDLMYKYINRSVEFIRNLDLSDY